MPKYSKMLLISSAILLICIFGGVFTPYVSKIMALGFIQYMIVIGFIMNKSIFSKVPISKMIESNDKTAEESFKEKKYTKALVHALAIPMSAIGIIVVLINIALMLFV